MTQAQVLTRGNYPGLDCEFAREIAIFDRGLYGVDRLLSGVRPGIQTAILEGTGDGMTQLAGLLRQPGLQRAHLFCHGAPGALYLGNRWISTTSLQSYRGDLRAWTVRELAIYGCRVAAGSAGEAFLRRLHALSGAQVAAATGSVGSAALGGQWLLDFRTGPTELHLALSPEAIAAYPSLL